MTLSAPVAFFIFKRPDVTNMVFETIRHAKPSKLLLIADGPRTPDETDKCEKARAVVEKIDWDCKVFKNYSDINLGCKKRLSSGIDWVFDIVKEAIILEDDCLPCSSFFIFCEMLLKKYRHDERIMQINGSNLNICGSTKEESYYFSRLTYSVGWASWRRAWRYYDVDMKLWPEARNHSILSNILTCAEELDVRRNIWDKVYSGEIDSWAYQWFFTCLCQGGLTITPNKNLVSIMGYGEDATHTKDSDSNYWFANLPTSELIFPLNHPKFMIRDIAADRLYFEKMYGYNNMKKFKFFKQVKKKLCRLSHH